MRLLIVLTLLLGSIFPSKSHSRILASDDPYITYEVWSGRFGDQLLLLAKTIWVGHKLKLPLRYRYNPYLDGLRVSLLQKAPEPFRIVKLRMSSGHLEDDRPVEVAYDFREKSWGSNVLLQGMPDLKRNKAILRKFRSLAVPKDPSKLNLVRPKEGYVGVAIHVRMNEHGHSFQTRQIHSDPTSVNLLHSPGKPPMDLIYPDKMPPLQYYVDQLNRVGSMLKGKKFHVFIFTDHPSPKIMAQVISKHLRQPHRFVLDYRKGGINKSMQGVYDDFFSLLNFDILIRPMASNFSQTAQLFKDYEMVIYPTAFELKGDCMLMKDIVIDRN